MSAIKDYGRWVLSCSWARNRPPSLSLTWGGLAVSWAVATVLVASVFALLAAGGFVEAVVVALLSAPAQAAVLVGLVYAARRP